jgi:hypothetical protein
MKAQLRKSAIGAMAIGFALALAGFVANALLGMLSARLAHGFSLLIVFGNAIFVWGCILFARAKGQPWYLGLLGLLSCLGLALLWFVVPDKA